MLVFGFFGLSVWSLLQHRRSSEELALLQQGLLPLALTFGEARATQAVVASMIERLSDASDRTTETWLEHARSLRRQTLRRARQQNERMAQLPASASISTLHDQIEVNIQNAELAVTQADAELTEAKRLRTEAAISRLGSTERLVGRHFRSAWNELQARITALSVQAQLREERTAQIVFGSAAFLLTLGLLAFFWTRYLLTPLTALTRRLLAVGQGDLSALKDQKSEAAKVLQQASRRLDEIGTLTREFDSMVVGIAQARARAIRSERLAAIGKMAAHVTHEIRNPLSSIGLNVEILADELLRVSASEAQKKELGALVTAILKELDRLRGVTEEYLRFVRLPAPKREPESPKDIVLALLDFMKAEIAASGVKIETEFGADHLVPIDEHQIRQVLINLIRNSLDVMPHGGTLRVTIGKSEKGDTTLSVEDSGGGVAASEQPHLFELFHSTKERGTGLGLAMALEVMSAHGGTIEYQPGRTGARFVLTFPPVTPSPPPADPEP